MATVGLPRMVARLHLTQLSEDQHCLVGAHALAYRDHQLSFSSGPSLAALSSPLALWTQAASQAWDQLPDCILASLPYSLFNLASTFIIL